MAETLKAGAAAVDITPQDSQFLYGYPHVKRYSTGVHDPLFSSALYLASGANQIIFIANDVIFVGKDLVQRCRGRIAEATGVPAGNIMVTATHTHSGPITVDYISNEADPVVPKADKKYLQLLENGIVSAAGAAFKNARSAQMGLATADSTGIGTNRRDPAGPADMQVPVLVAKTADGRETIACMFVCSMHPTVLHEDSTLVSGDFPSFAGTCLQTKFLGSDCVILCHTGPAGNQSPRYVTKANTFGEAQRLGEILGRAIAKAIPKIRYEHELDLNCGQEFVELPRKKFSSVAQSQKNLSAAAGRLAYLRKIGADRRQVRSAECDWFGAEETLTLAMAAENGRLDEVYRSCLPAEIQVMKIGPWNFCGWPGEIFVEYALALKAQSPDSFVISLANGELQGYVVTPEAANEGGYEASNALFSSESGQILVDKTLELLRTFD